MGKAQGIQLLAPLAVPALLLALLLGCGSGSPVTAPAPTATLVPPPTATSTPPPATATPLPKLCEQYTDQDLAWERQDRWKYGRDPDMALSVHDLVPGYGGTGISENGSTIYVWLQDTSQEQAVKAALLEVYGDFLFQGRKFQVRQGQYSIEQLYKWYFCMYDTFNTTFGIAVFFMDELVNRIRIDHYRAYDVEYMERVLERRGVPLDAVVHRQIVLCQGHTCHE